MLPVEVLQTRRPRLLLLRRQLGRDSRQVPRLEPGRSVRARDEAGSEWKGVQRAGRTRFTGERHGGVCARDGPDGRGGTGVVWGMGRGGCGRRGFSLLLLLLLRRRDGGLDPCRHAHPCECPQLRHPAAAQQPGEDHQVGLLVVLARDEAAEDARLRARQQGEYLGQRRQGGEETGVVRAGGGEAPRVGVRGHDVGVTGVERGDGTRTAPVDEMRGEEEDLREGDGGQEGDLREGSCGGAGPEVVG